MSELETAVQTLSDHAHKVVDTCEKTALDTKAATTAAAKLAADLETLDATDGVKDAEILKQASEAVVTDIENLKTELGAAWDALWDVEEAATEDAQYYYNAIVSLL